MMKIPSREEIAERIVALVEEAAEPTGDVTPDAPLIAELGLDSLDVIELGFSIQENFDFAFSDKNAIDELDRALGGDVVLTEGRLNDLGWSIVRERMPELATVEIPEELTIHQLQNYYTVNTFARLIHELYEALPERHPETDELVVIENFRVRTASGGEVPLPDGDKLVDAWIAEKAEQIRRERT